MTVRWEVTKRYNLHFNNLKTIHSYVTHVWKGERFKCDKNAVEQNCYFLSYKSPMILKTSDLNRNAFLFVSVNMNNAIKYIFCFFWGGVCAIYTPLWIIASLGRFFYILFFCRISQVNVFIENHSWFRQI